MIEKQRLEELIEQGATIFVITQQSFIAGVSNFIDIEKQKLSKENNIGKDNTLYWRDMGIAELEYLFETEEDAEFALRFKRIPRTEYLDLPTFEEFKDKAGGLMFYIKTGYVLLSISDDRKMVYIQGDELIFNALLTKENYLEACEICRKLWLGEKV